MLEQLSEWVGIIIGLLGIFIGIIIVLVVNILTDIKHLSDDTRIIKERVKEIREGPFIPPSPDVFLMMLATQTEFWQKLFIQRADKVRIASAIASNYIQHDDTIIVDSGTTVDQIPSILRVEHPNVEVYTNNLLAAISVVPPEEFDCFILSGRIDPIYGATYNIGDIGGPLESINPQQIILASGGISFEEGPLIDVRDVYNRKFKQELVKKAFQDPHTRLIIAVDWTKFKKGGNQLGNMNPVLEQGDWRAIRGTNRFVLVTTNPPRDLRTPDAEEAREVINKFLDNMKKGFMKIDIIETIPDKKEKQTYKGA